MCSSCPYQPSLSLNQEKYSTFFCSQYKLGYVGVDPDKNSTVRIKSKMTECSTCAVFLSSFYLKREGGSKIQLLLYNLYIALEGLALVVSIFFWKQKCVLFPIFNYHQTEQTDF